MHSVNNWTFSAYCGSSDMLFLRACLCGICTPYIFYPNFFAVTTIMTAMHAHSFANNANRNLEYEIHCTRVKYRGKNTSVLDDIELLADPSSGWCFGDDVADVVDVVSPSSLRSVDVDALRTTPTRSLAMRDQDSRRLCVSQHAAGPRPPFMMALRRCLYRWSWYSETRKSRYLVDVPRTHTLTKTCLFGWCYTDIDVVVRFVFVSAMVITVHSQMKCVWCA